MTGIWQVYCIEFTNDTRPLLNQSITIEEYNFILQSMKEIQKRMCTRE